MSDKLIIGAFALLLIIAAIEFVGYLSGQKTLKHDQQTLRHEVERNDRIIVRLQAQADDAEEAHAALCTFRATLADGVKSDRVSLQRSYLVVKKNPNGLLGFNHAQLAKSVADQAALLKRREASLLALSALSCPR